MFIIIETRGNVVDAFLVPQWGGVILYNDGHTHNSSRGSLVMDDVMFTVVKQLKLLLGLNEQKVKKAKQPICSIKCIHNVICFFRPMISIH